MGYSNYFRTDREFTSSEWNVITNMAKHVISVSGVIIRNAAGKEKPTINNDEISINGCAYLGKIAKVLFLLASHVTSFAKQTESRMTMYVWQFFNL